MKALSFDDISLIPRYSDITPDCVDTSTMLGKNLKLNVPILSAAMDTITESKMAIAMARNGGLGIIHRNLSIVEQVEEVIKVKKLEGGIVKKPVCVTPDMTIQQVKQLIAQNGFKSYPVVRKGEYDYLAGLITSRDIQFVMDDSITVEEVMKTNLIAASQGDSKEHMIEVMIEYKVERLPITSYKNGKHILHGLVNLKDLRIDEKYPHATRDKNGYLMVGAAIGTGRTELDRANALYKAGVDVIVIDTAHGNSKGVVDTVSHLCSEYPDLFVIAGNVVTPDGAYNLIRAGAKCIKVGMGGGSICTTRIISGVGIPQFQAIKDISDEFGGDVSIISDGGVRYSGDIVKAMVAGADAVMLGNLLSGTNETPGEYEIFQGKQYKTYRGMGSMSAMKERYVSNRYFQNCEVEQPQKLVPEGIEGRVQTRGPVGDILFQLMGGLKSGMGYTCSKNILDLQTKVSWVEVSSNGLRESHPHSVEITRNAPNYQGD